MSLTTDDVHAKLESCEVPGAFTPELDFTIDLDKDPEEEEIPASPTTTTTENVVFEIGYKFFPRSIYTLLSIGYSLITYILFLSDSEASTAKVHVANTIFFSLFWFHFVMAGLTFGGPNHAKRVNFFQNRAWIIKIYVLAYIIRFAFELPESFYKVEFLYVSLGFRLTFIVFEQIITFGATRLTALYLSKRFSANSFLWGFLITLWFLVANGVNFWFLFETVQKMGKNIQSNEYHSAALLAINLLNILYMFFISVSPSNHKMAKICTSSAVIALVSIGLMRTISDGTKSLKFMKTFQNSFTFLIESLFLVFAGFNMAKGVKNIQGEMMENLMKSAQKVFIFHVIFAVAAMGSPINVARSVGTKEFKGLKDVYTFVSVGVIAIVLFVSLFTNLYASSKPFHCRTMSRVFRRL